MKPTVQGLGRVSRYAYRKAGRKRFEARWRDLDGRIRRKAFTDRKAFDFFCGETATAISNGRSARFRLTEREASDMEWMKEDAARLGMSPLEVYLAGKGERLAAVSKAPGISVGELVAKFVAAKESQGLSAYHLRDLRARLGRFGAAFQVPVARIEAELVRDWLDGLKVGPRTWNNFLATVVALGRFGREHGICDWRLETIERRNLPDREPGIFTPAQMRLLLEAANDGLRRCLAISAFAGLRSEEVSRLRWEDFDWANGVVFLRKAVVKGQSGQRSARSVPLRPNLVEWLRPWHEASGLVCPYRNSKSLAGMKWALARRVGLRWEQNAPRHSWISYQVAETGDVHQTATLAGNSPKMIRDHYLRLVTPKQAAQWFEIRQQNVSSGLLKLDFRRCFQAK